MQYAEIDYFFYKKYWKMANWLHAHEGYEIFYVHEGNCRYFVGSTYFDLEAGDFLISNSTMLHGPTIEETCIRTNIKFSEPYVQSMVLRFVMVNVMEPFRKLKHFKWRLNDEQRTDIEAILLKMASTHQKQELMHANRFHIAFMDLMLLIYTCSKEAVEQQAWQSEKAYAAVDRVISFIDDNLDHELTLDQLADAMHVNKFYLVKLFKDMLGMTVFDYINRRRVYEAKLLLLANRNRSVTDIAFEVGFKQLSHFSANFKKIVGLPPERFRKSVYLES